ncbi:hypothetical protein BDY21DRAFT_365135 [Lineolata rhizophorae]|uniref:PHD-type domain-containing protein n=1 Tax=Lineolata rhizophorae TaxID=578093 RepID=A0A6A6NWI1_9PEZI|nr:hypothetical protein BDY21DRAFT_365135 [Lineolata rhizophorae]
MAPRTHHHASSGASHPDAQATVSDFLDYTEYFPADLARSLTLIGKLDATYRESLQRVHELTTAYGQLPAQCRQHQAQQLSDEKPAQQAADATPTAAATPTIDPRILRAQISAALDHALHCRESAHAEAARLYDVAQRHATRLDIIKRKLQALPQPPSRDPTPAPAPAPAPTVSVSPTRARKPGDDHQQPQRSGARIQFSLSAGRRGDGAAVARARQQHRVRRVTVPGEVLPPPDPNSPPPSTVETDWSSTEEASDSDEDDIDVDALSPSGVRNSIEAIAPSQPRRGGKPGRVKIPKGPRSRPPKTPKTPRVRPPGVMGTNVHSAVAGISTSNALAKLTPPPADAKPGSRWAPWHKLTEYEMAVLRKAMKKNAIWAPSETMIRRELAAKGRGWENYEKAKAAAEAAGDLFLDEDPVDLSKKTLGPGETTFKPMGSTEEALFNRGMKLNEAKKLKKENQAREQAARDAMEIEEASKRIENAGNKIKNLFDTIDLTPTQQNQLQQHQIALAFPPPQQTPTPGFVASTPPLGFQRAATGSTTPTAEKRKEPPKSTKKRKRDSASADATTAAAATVGANPIAGDGVAPTGQSQSQDSSASPQQQPPKKLKIALPSLSSTIAAAAAGESTVTAPSPRSAASNTQPELMRPPPSAGAGAQQKEQQTPTRPSASAAQHTVTTHVPLLPAGPSAPSSPSVGGASATDTTPPRHTTTVKLRSPAPLSPTEIKIKPSLATAAARGATPTMATTPTPTATTAAGQRSRRTSLAAPRAQTPLDAPVSAGVRPRSRGGIKAASAEPSTGDGAGMGAPSGGLSVKRELRELRRASNVSMPASVAAAEHGGMAGGSLSAHGQGGVPQQQQQRAGGRRSKRPAPGALLQLQGADGEGSMGAKVSVGRRKAAPRKKGGRAGKDEERREKEKEKAAQAQAAAQQQHEDGWEDVDPDEPRYCHCGDVSYGTMIACENEDCEKEWFHLQCVGMTEIPGRRTKWFCSDCRKKLGIDERGQPAADLDEGVASAGMRGRK